MAKLSELKAGSEGKILSVAGNAHFQSRVTAVGITPGSTVKVIQNKRFHPMLIYTRNTLLAVNREDCDLIEMEG